MTVSVDSCQRKLGIRMTFSCVFLSTKIRNTNDVVMWIPVKQAVIWIPVNLITVIWIPVNLIIVIWIPKN